MAPRTESLRLSDLIPSDVARDVVRAVIEHVELLASYLAPGVHIQIAGEAIQPFVYGPIREKNSHLYQTVDGLVRFAQSGSYNADGNWDSASGSIDGVLSALHSCSVSTRHNAPFDISYADQSTPIGIVLIAANARVRLSSRGVFGLTARELSILAGISDAQVRVLARKGVLAIAEGFCQRAESKAWLRSRGVVGL